MHCAPRLLAPGFWRRSLDELRRLTSIAVNLEGLDTPKKAYPLFAFDKPETIQLCKKMSDIDIGGFSTVNLDYHGATSREPPHARFHGSISTQLPVDRPEIQRTGYAGWRTQDRGFTVFGKAIWDIDPFTYLALRVKSDGRKYFVNLQTESIVPTDLHQHRLYTKTPGEWETILIDFNDFVRTNHGLVVEPQSEILRQKVTTVGISSTDRMPGPYDLCISRIWATNALVEQEAEKVRLENEMLKLHSTESVTQAQS